MKKKANYRFDAYVRGMRNHPSIDDAVAANYNTNPLPFKTAPWPGIRLSDFRPSLVRKWRLRRPWGRRYRVPTAHAGANGPRFAEAEDRIRDEVRGLSGRASRLRFIKILGWGGEGAVAVLRYAARLQPRV